MAEKDYDFSCWVIDYNISHHYDLTYEHNTLRDDNDGIIVPLLWNHKHDDVDSVLGHAILEHHDDVGVYAYCYLNSDKTTTVREILKERGVLSLSPYIHKFHLEGRQIIGGIIREVSLTPERIDQNEAYYPVLKGEN